MTLFLLFFFKQKTAYEMRISDWSSDVCSSDLDQNKIATLKAGRCPFYEPGIEALLVRNAGAGRLDFTTDAPAGVAHGEIIFIAVGTPPQEDGSADLQYVLAVARTIGAHMNDYRVVCTKSTVPVGTSAKVREALQASLTKRGAEDRKSTRLNSSH